MLFLLLLLLLLLLLMMMIMTKPQYGTLCTMSATLAEQSPKQKNLVSPKLIEFADDNFRFDENASKFSKSVENTVGKGEIARDEQFLLFPRCFQN